MRDIFFERNYRIKIPYPAYFFGKARFMDIITGSAILLKSYWRSHSISLKYASWILFIEGFRRLILFYCIYCFLAPWSFGGLLLLYKNFSYRFNFFFFIIILYILIFVIYLFYDYFLASSYFFSIFKLFLSSFLKFAISYLIF
jgi:hypothetical protein